MSRPAKSRGHGGSMTRVQARALMRAWLGPAAILCERRSGVVQILRPCAFYNLVVGQGVAREDAFSDLATRELREVRPDYRADALAFAAEHANRKRTTFRATSRAWLGRSARP